MGTRSAVRQGKFYELSGFDSKGVFRFNSVDVEVMDRINKELENHESVDVLEDVSNNLLLSNCRSFSDKTELLEWLFKVIDLDLKDNIATSKKEGWDFFYFIGKTYLVKGALLVVANLFYPPNESEGNTLYNLLFIKSDGKLFYVWDTLS